jgi:MFS superfamily sulfate permease-like transporter
VLLASVSATVTGSPLILFYFPLQESIGIAKTLAAKHNYELDSNQEVHPSFSLNFLVMVYYSGN